MPVELKKNILKKNSFSVQKKISAHSVQPFGLL